MPSPSRCMSPRTPPLVPHETIYMLHTHLLAPIHQIPACLISPTQSVLPTYMYPPPPLPTLALKSPPITIFSLFPIATCLSMSHLHVISLCRPHQSPSLVGTQTLILIPLPLVPPSPQTTSAVPSLPTFPALLPLTSLPPSSRGSAPPSPHLPPTKPLCQQHHLPPLLPHPLRHTSQPTPVRLPHTQPPHIPCHHKQQRHQSQKTCSHEATPLSPAHSSFFPS